MNIHPADEAAITDALGKLPFETGPGRYIQKHGVTAQALCFTIYSALSRTDLRALNQYVVNGIREHIQLELVRSGNFMQLHFW